MVESCSRSKYKRYLHPIIDWETDDVWEYIRVNKLPYCSLYDEGWKRIGCIGCPMAGAAGMRRDFARWPKYYKAYAAAAAAAAANNLAKAGATYSGKHLRWVDGEAMMRWWMQEVEDSPLDGGLFEGADPEAAVKEGGDA